MTAASEILVVDDEIGICEAIRRALTPMGFNVDIADNGTQGLTKIRAGSYELALIDVMMPGIGGIDLIAAIHQHDPEIVCIIITGYATVELAVRAIKQGAYDFLTKPFTVDDLALAVNQGLERRRLSLEAHRLHAVEAEARRLAEEKARLEELDKAKKQFIRLVTHELQRPIADIYNYLQLLLEGYVEPDELRSVIEKSRARALEQMELIADLLELGQIQILTTPAKGEPVQLDRILADVLETVYPRANLKGVKINVETNQPVPPVWGLAARLRSVWANLISNAVKYTPDGGCVTVAQREDHGRIVGEVTDTGIGIPEEDQGQIFGEFFRAGNARALEIPGTGLGLTIVKKIVEDAGGSISFESQPGRGTRFEFKLPVWSEPGTHFD
ncbi:MAG: hybrid sensor histidine kinase/response regulator [Acidobacteria bacterium]|nr:MAG: hybrid sensor histidine kinase/response regulator [Acidobacteriota bacterium]